MGRKQKKEKIVESSKHSSYEIFFSSIFQISDIGFSLCLPTVGGVLVGNFIDKKMHTTPQMTLSFLVLGTILSFFMLWKIVKKYSDISSFPKHN